jgi:DNA-directed RNA polymerase subunit H (RpoH/RPB5)
MWNNNSHWEAFLLTLRPVEERFRIPKASSRNEVRSASTQMHGRLVKSIRPSNTAGVIVFYDFFGGLSF